MDNTFINNQISISTDIAKLDFNTIYCFLNEKSYWAKGIQPERLRKAIENSMCFGVYKAGSQAGFARVVTDKATFAYLCDVFILPDYRKIGLSKLLMETIKAHPDLQGIRRWALATADAHGLYKQYGFTPLSRTDIWMEIFTPYQENS